MGQRCKRPPDGLMVAAERFAGLDAALGNPWCDAARLALAPAAAMVVALVGTQLV